MFDSLYYPYLIGSRKQLPRCSRHTVCGIFSRCKIKEKTFHALTKKVEIRFLSVKYHNFYGLTDYSKPFIRTFPTSSAFSPKQPFTHPHALRMKEKTVRKYFSTDFERVRIKGFLRHPNHLKNEKQATYKFQPHTFPKQPAQHALPLQHIARQPQKDRSNGQNAQKARFHRRNTGAGGSRKSDRNRFLSEKDICAEKQTCRCTTRHTRLPTAFQTNRHHPSCHPPATRHLFLSNNAVRCIGHRNALHQPSQRAASAIAAHCM